MKCKVEKTKNANEVKIELTVEAQKFEEAIKKVYFQSAKYFNIPGFRKGKAPLQIVEKYYGKEIFYEDAFNELAPEVLEEAVKENNLEIVSRPEIDITQIEKGKDLIFTAVMQTKPEVELGKYKGIEIKKIEYNVTDEDIDHELHHMQEHNSRLVNVENRPVEKGDTTVIDFEGFVDGVAFDGGKAEGHELEIGSNTFIPGFEDQIIGMKMDEEKDINVKFPDEYFSKDLAGKDATFKVKLHEIKKKELPKLDDEFAKDVSEYDTLEELKNANRERLEAYAKTSAENQMKDAAILKVVEANDVEIPRAMVEDEIDRMIGELNQQLRYQGITIDKYLEFTGKSMADFREEVRPEAEKAVKTRIILMGIVEAEKIEVSAEEMEKELELMAAQYQMTADKIKEMIGVENLTFLQKDLQVRKAIDFIYDNAKIK